MDEDEEEEENQQYSRTVSPNPSILSVDRLDALEKRFESLESKMQDLVDAVRLLCTPADGRVTVTGRPSKQHAARVELGQ